MMQCVSWYVSVFCICLSTSENNAQLNPQIAAQLMKTFFLQMYNGTGFIAKNHC